MLFLYGFLTCWVIIGGIAVIADYIDHSGISLDEKWAAIILILPYYIVSKFLIRPIYCLIKHKKEKEKERRSEG